MTTPHDDEIYGKGYDGALMRRLIVFVRPHWRRLVVALALLLVAAAAELAPPYLVKLAIDGPIANRNVDGILPIFFAYLGALLLSFICRYGQTYIMQSTGQQVMVEIRTQLFAHIQKMSLSFFDRNPVGRLLTRLTNDVDALNEFLSQGLVALLGDSTRLLFIVIAMLWINWRLALISFIVLPIAAIATSYFEKVMRQAFREVRQRLAKINAFLNEQITGILITQLFNREERSQQRFADLSSDYKAAQHTSLRAFAIFFPVVNFLGIVAMALQFNLGGMVVMQGLATVGLLVAFIQYTDLAFGPIRQIAENYNTLQSAMASSERIFRILDTPEDIVDPVTPKHLQSPVRGEIEFRDVVFGYVPGEPVLKGISFTIPPGQAVAIVGATGAGKTSLISLMARFYDIQEGSITLDGIDLRDIPQRELRRHISAVPQDPICFSGTIASNIRLHDDSISDAAMYAAAQQANAAPFIERLPGKYEYEVRERGSNLSVGQRQLLAFARAIAFNPEVMLILDEATSSVDTETETLIQTALERLLHGRTSIVIAHRLSTIRHVDRIIVLHKGHIVEDGSHEELLAKRGFYHRLYELQFADQGAVVTGEEVILTHNP